MEEYRYCEVIEAIAGDVRICGLKMTVGQRVYAAADGEPRFQTSWRCPLHPEYQQIEEQGR